MSKDTQGIIIFFGVIFIFMLASMFNVIQPTIVGYVILAMYIGFLIGSNFNKMDKELTKEEQDYLDDAYDRYKDDEQFKKDELLQISNKQNEV